MDWTRRSRRRRTLHARARPHLADIPDPRRRARLGETVAYFAGPPLPEVELEDTDESDGTPASSMNDGNAQ